MSGKSIHLLMEELYLILKKEGELSIRQLSLRTGSQWITVKKALSSLEKLGVTKQRLGTETKRMERLFSLK